MFCIGIGGVDAAVRDANSINRDKHITTNTKIISRSTSKKTSATPRATTTNITPRSNSKTVSRTTTNRLTSRSAVVPTTTRNTVQARNATQRTVSRSTTTSRNARAAIISPTVNTSNTFGSSYNACRDAYFTCMDQFCASQNETYRRCVCSSRLVDVQARERALGQSADQIQDFKDLNIYAITKTGAEVNAMLTATDGELTQSGQRDTSNSAIALSGISDVLNKAKSKSLSTQGTLDIAGDINAIWSTTDLAQGANIANMTGETLYNAVHTQCADLVSKNCTSESTLNMVISAYGMYIENDCALLLTQLDKKLNAANSTIRDTEREMQLARLENYNNHNSTSINDCTAKVRTDITSEAACGPDYIHCLDITGQYLNYTTGEPIYSPDFYKLGAQISLAGDILLNPVNRTLINELNRKRDFAKTSLETCVDLADDVWDEFLRQAVTEIYQGQQARIRQVKNECLDVVNKCYDETSNSLKDFTNVKDQTLIGSRLELSEEMCREKLDACANLYGDGNGNGLDLLVQAMHNITNQKIAANCRVSLEEYAQEMCAVPSNDNLHSYPYECRVYAPGDQQYALNPSCNQLLWTLNKDNFASDTGGTDTTPETNTPTYTQLPDGYVCDAQSVQYSKCMPGYYMVYNDVYNGNPTPGNRCAECNDNLDGTQTADGAYICPGGTSDRILQADYIGDDDTSACGDYPGSLYQKLVRYAMQTCARPSEVENQDNYVLPTTVLEDVNVVMDSIRVSMAQSLATECERLGGIWVSTQWINKDKDNDLHDITKDSQFKTFYDETGANTKWGYCAEKTTSTTQTPDEEQ